MAWELLPSPTRSPRAQAPATTTPSLRCAGIFGPHPAGPRSGVQDHQLGFIGSAPVRPACSKTTRSSQGSTLPHRGRPACQVHRSPTGSACKHPRYLTAAPGSTVLNRPAPARESKLQARVHRRHSGPARLLQVTTSVRVLRPAPGDGPPSQVHRPRTGSACHLCSPLRRVLRSSTGRPRSGAWVACSGSSGLL